MATTYWHPSSEFLIHLVLMHTVKITQEFVTEKKRKAATWPNMSCDAFVAFFFYTFGAFEKKKGRDILHPWQNRGATKQLSLKKLKCQSCQISETLISSLLHEDNSL